MENIKDIKERILKIGRKLVECEENCIRINNNKNEGIIPRCLIFETNKKENNNKGCVIIGLNPGKSRRKEREFYKDKKDKYNAIIDYWNNNIRNISYYSRLREIAKSLNCSKYILWTELAKCERREETLNQRDILLDVFRRCSNKFLKNELKHIPEDWLIFAVSYETFKALSYIYPERTIIGIPHPTASHGSFYKIYDQNNNRLIKKYKKIILNSINNNEEITKTLWLSPL